MTTMLVEPFAPWLRELSQAMQTPGSVAAFVPPADLLVDDNGVHVYMDVPGLRSEDLEIELENDVLTVRGERPYPYERDQGSAPAHRIERGFGRFERSLRVPGGLDPDAIEASLSDGVLTLRIPKPQRPSARRIEIKGETNGGGRAQASSEGRQETDGGGRTENAGAER
jgi:HSP20 family protein